jgi:hypothetical protein
MTDGTNVCVMVQNVSTVLIRHHQEIFYNTEKKYTKCVKPNGELLLRPKLVALPNTTVMT